MKATRFFVIGIAILVGVILLLWIIGVYHKQDTKNFVNISITDITNTSVIEPITKNGIEISQDVEINAPVPFKVGNEYVYETVPVVKPEGRHKGKHEFTRYIVKVVGEERIDGKEYYKVVTNVTFYYITQNNSIEERPRVPGFNYTLWFDKNTGRCISKIPDPLNFSNSDLIATHSSMFAYWMLGLKDNLRFNMKFKGFHNDLYIHDICEFEVVGREKVNDRECFKVKEVWKCADTGRIWYINYYWVDVKERILVRDVAYSDGYIKVHDKNLVRVVSN